MSSSCIICLENLFAIGHYPFPKSYSTCKHETCKKCLRVYLNESLNIWHQKQYESVCCPDYGCSGVIKTINIVDKVFSKEEAEKWWETVIKRTCISNKVGLINFG